MAVYDDQKNADNEELRGIAGNGRGEEDQVDAAARKNTKKGLGAKALEAAESGAGFAKDNFNKFKGEAAALGAAAGAASNAVPGGPVAAKLLQTFIKGSHAKRNSGIAGVASAAIITVVALFSMGTSQPLAFVKIATDMGQMFNSSENAGDNRLGKLFQYAKGTPERTNLGVIGNKIADSYEKKLSAKGVKINYNSSGRIASITVDPDADGGKQALERLRQQGVGTAELKPDADGKITVDLTSGNNQFGNTRQRRIAISGLIGTLEMNKVTAAMGSRILKTRGGVDFHPLKNAVASADERTRAKFTEWKEERKAKRAESIETGQKLSSLEAGYVVDEEGKQVNPDGRSKSEVDSALKEVTGGGGSNRAKGLAIKGIGVTAVVGLICAVDEVGDQAIEMKWIKIVEPLMRFGMQFMIIGNQIMTGQDVNMDELGVLYESLYDEGAEDDPTTPDVNEARPATSFFDAASYRGYLGEDVSSITDRIDPNNPDNSYISGYDMPANAKVGAADQRPPGFEQLNSFISMIGGDGVCGFVNSTWGGAITGIVGLALSGAGPVGWAAAGASTAAMAMLERQLMPLVVGWLSGNVLDVSNAVGAPAGNYTAYGVRLASNENAIASGGDAMTTAQSATLNEYNHEMIAAQTANQSVYEKYLNIHNTKSIASQMAFTVKSNLMGSTSSKVASILSGNPIKSSFSTLLTKKTNAASTYDFGFPEYGFSADVLYSDTLDDPYANAAYVEPKLKELNDKYGNACFGTTIDPTTFAVTTDPELAGGRAIDYRNIEKNCAVSEADRTNPASDFNRYRVYILDHKTALSAACYEGIDDQACVQVGMSDPVSAASPTDGGEQASGDMSQDYLQAPSDTVACAAGTKDLGVHDGYVNKVKVPVRLCGLSGFRSSAAESSPSNAHYIAGAEGAPVVNSKVSGKLMELLTAMRAAGIEPVINSAFRSNSHQTYLYNCYRAGQSGCNMAAVPGTSNHQMGLALDFSLTGNTHSWLTANAKTYGYAQLPAERWHWNPESLNR